MREKTKRAVSQGYLRLKYDTKIIKKVKNLNKNVSKITIFDDVRFYVTTINNNTLP